jgi:SnoaL-like domain
VTVTQRQARGLLKTVRPAFEEANRAWNEGDVRRAYRTLPEDFEYRLSNIWPNARPLRGRDEVIAFFEDWRQTFPDAQAGPIEFIEVDERRLILGFPVIGTGRSSGVSTEMEIWQLWELDGTFTPTRVTEFGSRDAVLEVAGVYSRERPR